MPSYVKGVANIRGNILAIVDLEAKFGLQAGGLSEESTSNYTLVAESKDFNVGILVKEVPNTLRVLASDIDETVNVVQNTADHGNYVLGIVKIDERLIILIDLVQIMQTHDLHGVGKESPDRPIRRSILNHEQINNIMAKKVLIVDDSMYMRKLIKDAVEEGGYDVVGEAANGEDAIDLAIELTPTSSLSTISYPI